MKEPINVRIQMAMNKRKLKAVDICQHTGIPKSSMSMYLSGSVEPKSDRLYLIARYLDVSEAWLLGYDVPMDRPPEQKENDTLSDITQRMAAEKDFRELIIKIHYLKPGQIDAVKSVVDAFNSDCS